MSVLSLLPWLYWPISSFLPFFIILLFLFPPHYSTDSDTSPSAVYDRPPPQAAPRNRQPPVNSASQQSLNNAAVSSSSSSSTSSSSQGQNYTSTTTTTTSSSLSSVNPQQSGHFNPLYDRLSDAQSVPGGGGGVATSKDCPPPHRGGEQTQLSKNNPFRRSLSDTNELSVEQSLGNLKTSGHSFEELSNLFVPQQPPLYPMADRSGSAASMVMDMGGMDRPGSPVYQNNHPEFFSGCSSSLSTTAPSPVLAPPPSLSLHSTAAATVSHVPVMDRPTYQNVLDLSSAMSARALGMLNLFL